MQAVRTRAACVARQTARPAMRASRRTYASESHAAPVNESLGAAFYVFAGAVPAGMLGYWVSRPGADGQPSTLSSWLSNNFDYFNSTWEERNTIRTDLFEQAAHDRHLLVNAGKSGFVDIKTPELINSGAPWNVPAGHYANLDHVTEHYRKQYHAEEERKAAALAAKKQ